MGVSDEEVPVFDIRPYGDIPYMAYINPIDQQIALSRSAADGGDVPCMREKMVDGEPVNTMLPTDQCVFMESAKVWHGRWLNHYEHSVFCPNEVDQKNVTKRRPIYGLHLVYSASPTARAITYRLLVERHVILESPEGMVIWAATHQKSSWTA